MGWVQILQRAEFSRRTGKNQLTNMVLGRVPVSCPLRSSTATLSTHIPQGRFQIVTGTSIQPVRPRFHTGSGSNTPGCFHSVLRIAYYLSWVLSAQLTTHGIVARGSHHAPESIQPTFAPVLSVRFFYYTEVADQVGHIPLSIFNLFLQCSGKPLDFLPDCGIIIGKIARLRRTQPGSFSKKPFAACIFLTRLGHHLGKASPHPTFTAVC